jgi:hypothetical protein
MSLSEYNNQTLLTIKDVRPMNDDLASERGNSLRSLGRSTNINKWFECRDACLNNPDCVIYRFDKSIPQCEIFRKEPYKEIKNLSLEGCTEFCSKDKECDFLSHSTNNTCQLYTRENDKSKDKKSKTSIGDLWLNFPVYGLNVKDGVSAKSFEECKKKLGSDYFVYYDDAKYCVPKRFFTQSAGDTTIYFDKTPVDKYKALNELSKNKFLDKFGLDYLRSESREIIEKYRVIIIVFFLILLFLLLFYIVRLDEDDEKNK